MWVFGRAIVSLEPEPVACAEDDPTVTYEEDEQQPGYGHG